MFLSRTFQKTRFFPSTLRAFSSAIERDTMEYDVLIVGGGPAGLASAIKIRQLCEEHDKDLSVCLIEKGSHIGAHILSGNVFEPRAFNELFPDWQAEEDLELRAPLDTKVTEDKFYVLTGPEKSFEIPSFLHPKSIHNHGNYIISLGRLCEWMNEKAEDLGVDILPATAGNSLIYNDDGSVAGVVTGDMGIAKDETEKDSFEPGIEIRAR